MANRWRNNGNSDKDFIFLGSKITADGDCSHEIKTLAPWKKSMTNLDSILKSRDIIFPTKVCLVKAMVFSVVKYACESWTIKKAEYRRMMLLNCGVGEDSWDSLGLQGDQTSQSSRKSVLNIHWKDWSWNSNALATCCEELTHLKRPWCWERLKARGEGDDRGGDCWMASATRWTWVWVSSSSWWWTGRPGALHSMGSQRVGHDWATELNWTEPIGKWVHYSFHFCLNSTVIVCCDFK